MVIQADDFVAETKETFNKSHSEVDVSISVDENTAGNENTMLEESFSMNRLKYRFINSLHVIFI